MNCVDKLAAVIEMILQYHPFGLRVITGDVQPTTDELWDILASLLSSDEPPQRIAAAFPSSSQERNLMKIESIIEIVNMAGGWAGIATMAREFRKKYVESWEIFRSHVEWIDVNMRTQGESDTALERIAFEFGISTDTVQRKRRFVVRSIAAAALRTDRVLM